MSVSCSSQQRQHGLPTGGKKPSSLRKASSKKATSAVKSILAAADDIRWTKRANKDPVASPSTDGSSSVSIAQDQSHYQSALYGVMANTVNFSTPVPPPPPPLLHFSPELVKDSFYATQPQSPVWQSYGASSIHPTAPDSSVGQPFGVIFLNARILRRQGCRGRIEQGQPWWYCSSTQRACSLPESENWKLADVKEPEEHILPPTYEVYCSLSSWFELLRNSSERWYQGTTEPYPCEPFEWQVLTSSQSSNSSRFTSCFQVQLPNSTRHSLACVRSKHR